MRELDPNDHEWELNAMKLNVKVTALFDQLGLALPSRGSPQSAGLDLRACIESDLSIQPGQKVLIGTGVSFEPAFGNFEVPLPVVGLVFVRSGLGAGKSVTLANSVGVIDQDYRGEIKVALINHSDSVQVINPGDRIAQIVWTPILMPTLERVEGFSSQTDRGNGGFGSTGAN